MSEGNEIRDLKRKVEDLQVSLYKYHRHLEHSLERDRRFQMDATWGILRGASSIGALIGAGVILKWLALESWLIEMIVGVVLFLSIFAITSFWIEKGKAGDDAKLTELPEWDKIAPPFD